MRVSDVMTNPVFICPPGSDLRVAAQLMWEHDVGVIPVVDFEGRLAGIVTDQLLKTESARAAEDNPLGRTIKIDRTMRWAD